MRHSRVIIASTDASTERADWWSAELARCWTRDERAPIFEPAPLTELADAGGGEAEAVVLVCPPGQERGAGLMQTLDRLIGDRTPTLVLTERAPQMRLEIEPHGVVVERLDAPAPAVAAAVQTLLVRQAALRLLAAELRVARASQSGLSGEIGRLHDELQLAGAVQRRFLPRELPTAGGYEFGVLFRPCGFVSGDIYDAVEIDGGRIAFMVADAVGHGVPAALLTLVLGRALRLNGPAGGDHPLASPARTLARLNEEMCLENETGDRFATAVCGVIDTTTGWVRLASAGHPAPVLVDAAGAARHVEAGDGPLLGVFPEAEFTERRMLLGAGEALLLYSDGFETAFPDPEAASAVAANHAYLNHFARAALDTDAGEGGAARTAERLGTDLDSQAGSLNQRDDLTALVLRRAAATLRLPESREAARTAA